MVSPSLSRRWLIAAFVLPLLLVAGWAGWLMLQTAPPSARIAEPAPDFVLADLDGNPLRLADLRGRPVVVNFWASWCADCLDEFPLFSAALAEHADAGLVVVGIVFRDRSEAALEFMSRMGAGWPVAMDPGETVATRYAIVGPPATFFIDRDGILVGRQIGPIDAATLDRRLSEILGAE
ncbi:MAG TPA: TlpA disulfide reductase family protein [Candidatus Limnocylindria bacterium]|nr:TlpA disulfide reductase family protein [Candidatus Limnocylindria bacterium]